MYVFIFTGGHSPQTKSYHEKFPQGLEAQVFEEDQRYWNEPKDKGIEVIKPIKKG